MNKRVIREKDNGILAADMIVYIAIALIGYIILNLSWKTVFNPLEDIAILFFVFAFFSIVTYFINRRKEDYEFLIFSLINVLIAAFIFYFNANPDSGYTLKDAVLIYAVLNVINKIIHIRKLLVNRNLNALPKIAVTVLLVLLGIFMISSFYYKVEDHIFILGYYLITFGVLSLFEPLLALVMTNKKVERFLMILLSYELDEDDEEEFEPKKISVVTNKKKTKKIVKKDKPEQPKKKKKKKE
ncbi:MAG: hypothetical protein IJ966_01175 [Bacilli bacterium]|nr:hypothetical protein [Bacilli bacterium]